MKDMSATVRDLEQKGRVHHAALGWNCALRRVNCLSLCGYERPWANVLYILVSKL